MIRRNFVKTAALSGMGVITSSSTLQAKNDTNPFSTFRLNYATHDGFFKHHVGNKITDQLKFAHSVGFRSFEDNDMRLRDATTQSALGEAVASLGMTMGVIVGHSLDWRSPTLTKPEAAVREKFLKEINDTVEIAKRCNSKHVVVVPGVINHNVELAFQRAHVLDLLRKAADILGKHQITLLLEPLNFVDHPGQLLADIPSIYQMVKSVNNEYCKIMFDVYHVQIHTGNIIPNIDMAWDEIEYFQVADNPGRMEPGTGEINYKNVFEHIYKKGFRGIIGMEHSLSMDNKKGEEHLVKVYKEIDPLNSK